MSTDATCEVASVLTIINIKSSSTKAASQIVVGLGFGYFHAVHLPAHAVYVEVARLLTFSQCKVAILASTRKPLVIGATCMSQFGREHGLVPSFSCLTATELSTSIGLRVLCECPALEESDLIAELVQIYSQCVQMPRLRRITPHNPKS